MTQKKLLDIHLPTASRQDILENILKSAQKRKKTKMVMSLNPEIIVIAQNNPRFKSIIQNSQFKIIDGVGVVAAARVLNVPIGPRYSGVDLTKDLLEAAPKRSLRILLIGGKENIAEEIANCYSKQGLGPNIKGIEGYSDVRKPTQKETNKIFSIVADLKPHLVFVAFGSPTQEIWIDTYRDKFDGAVCLGIGGSFDFISGKIQRAPKIIQKIGFEWLFRLLKQPWRWRRQLRLITFVICVIKEKFKRSNQ